MLTEEQIKQLKEFEKIIQCHVQKKWDGELLASMCVGSHAYGLALPTSDLDMRSIHSVSLRYFLTVDPMTPQSHSATMEIKSHGDKELDIQSVEVGKFASLCLKCNPSVLEMLFMPDELILSRSDIYNQLRDNRIKFIGKKQLIAAYVGYATSQLQRFVNPVLDAHGFGRVKVDLFHPETFLDVTEHIETVDYDHKNATHCLRLLIALTHALLTSELLVDVSFEAEKLMQIRTGQMVFDEVLFEIYTRCTKLRQLEEYSTLPEVVDEKFVNDILYNFRTRQIMQGI